MMQMESASICVNGGQSATVRSGSAYSFAVTGGICVICGFSVRWCNGAMVFAMVLASPAPLRFNSIAIDGGATMSATQSQKLENEEGPMPTTSRALLAEIIDYAGLFPPAKLPMNEAFRRFLGHLAGDDGWLLARFVCPASRLDELAPLLETTDLAQTPLRIAVLGAGGDDPPSFAEALENDLELLRNFNAQLEGKAATDVFEVKLPGQGDPSEVVDFTLHHLGEVAARPPVSFFEVSLLDDRQDPVMEAMAVAAASHQIDERRRAGLKIRCGGLDASAVPSVGAVAASIAASLMAGLPLKATQGLHHPIRRHDPNLGTMVHGFLNLFAAAVLVRDHACDEATIHRIVGEEDPEAFALTESTLSWRDLKTGFQGVVDGRTLGMTSFGSCSFTEPRDDLADLGWL